MADYLSRITYYLANMLPGAVLALTAYAGLYGWRRRRLERLALKSSLTREAVMALFWMFCGGMAVLTLTPWGFHWIVWMKYGVLSDQGTFFALGDVNLIPFRSVEVWNMYTVINLIGNLVMFLPFGFFAALLWRGMTLGHAAAAGLALTAAIECWQLTVGRAFDIDDLLLNTLGVMAGYLLWRLADRLLPRRLTRLWVQSD